MKTKEKQKNIPVINEITHQVRLKSEARKKAKRDKIQEIRDKRSRTDRALNLERIANKAEREAERKAEYENKKKNKVKPKLD